MRKTIGVVIDSNKHLAYVLATGSQLKDLRLFPIDLATGNQGADISNFADASKGIDSSAIVAMAYDPEQHLIYVSTMPANVAIKPQILSIDTLTGERKLVADDTRGTGPSLVKPTGLALGANHSLYVADNSAATVLAVDLTTGNRTVIASSTTADFKIDAPLHLLSDISASHNRLFLLPNASSNYILQLNLAAAPVTSALISDSSKSAQGATQLYKEPAGMVFAPGLNSLFVSDALSGIVKVDIATGNRAKFLEPDWIESYMAVDGKKQRLYLVDGLIPGLFVVDPATAQKILISK